MHFTFDNFGSPLLFMRDFPDMSLQSVIKQNASDLSFDSLLFLSHPTSGWVWLNVIYGLEETKHLHWHFEEFSFGYFTLTG